MTRKKKAQRADPKVITKCGAEYMVVALHHAPSEFERPWFSVSPCFSYEAAVAVKQHVQREHDDVDYVEIFGFVGDKADERIEGSAATA